MPLCIEGEGVMNFLVRLICLVLLVLFPISSVYSLAPVSQRAVLVNPFIIEKIDFDLLQIDPKNSKVLQFKNRRTGDIWSLEFDQDFLRLPNPLFQQFVLPQPKSVGLKTFHLPGQSNEQLNLPEGVKSELQTVWVPLEKAYSVFQPLEWKSRIWEAAYFSHFYEIGSEEAYIKFQLYLGEKELFQIRDGMFLEGDGLWGLPVRNRRTGKSELLIYNYRPEKTAFEKGKIPLAHFVAKEVKDDLAVEKLWSYSVLKEQIETLQNQLAILNGTKSEEVNQQRRKLLRELNGRLAVRNIIHSKIRELNKLKSQLNLIVEQPWHETEAYFREGGVERRSWREKRTKPRFSAQHRRGVDRKKQQLRTYSRTIQNWLSSDLFQTVQEELLNLEKSLAQIQREFPHALIVRNVSGDQIGYRVEGNEKSPYPPIVVFSGWKGIEEDRFLKFLRSDKPQAQKLRQAFRFLVVTLPGYEHVTTSGKRYRLSAASDAKPETLLHRCAEAFNAILNAEGEDTAYVLGSGIGAAAAGEVGRQYWRNRTTLGNRVIDFPVKGMILYDPVMFNPSYGPDIEFSDLIPSVISSRFSRWFPRISSSSLLSFGNRLASEVLTHNLLRSSWLTLSSLQKGGRHFFNFLVREKLSREDIEARFAYYIAFLGMSQQKVFQRFQALQKVETFIMAPDTLEGRAIHRRVGNAKNASLFPGLGDMDADMVLFSLFRKVEKDHPQWSLDLLLQGVNPSELAL